MPAEKRITGRTAERFATGPLKSGKGLNVSDVQYSAHIKLLWLHNRELFRPKPPVLHNRHPCCQRNRTKGFTRYSDGDRWSITRGEAAGDEWVAIAVETLVVRGITHRGLGRVYQGY